MQPETKSVATLLKIHNLWRYICKVVKKKSIHDDNMVIMWRYIANLYNFQ